MNEESSNQINQETTAPSEQKMQLVEMLSLFWDKRIFIVKFTGVMSVLAVIITLLMSNQYRSTATLLPVMDQSKAGGLAALAELASMAGMGMGQASLEMLFPTIIQSEAVLKDIIYNKYQTKKFIQPVNLIEYWEIEREDSVENYELALKALRDELNIKVDKQTNVVTVSISTKERQLSSDIVNLTVQRLDRYIRQMNITNASEQRKWIEKRLEEVKIDLANAEDRLKGFREKNRIIVSPDLLLEQERLLRDVTVNSTLFVEMKKQYELARIQEVKDLPIINILDWARAAARKEKPMRRNIVLGTFAVSFFVAIVGVVLNKKYNSEMSDLKVFSQKIFSSVRFFRNRELK